MMKNLSRLKFIVIFIGAFLMSLNLFAQDVITTKKGEDIFSKVIEITLNEVKYRKQDNLSGPLISILKSDIIMIRYENGIKDIFNAIEQNKPEPIVVEEEDNFHVGQQDAQKYYKGYRPAANGTLATGILLSPLLGLIPVFVTIGEEPQDINLNYPDAKKFKNKDYNSGYKAEAFKIKKTKVWTNWGIACGVNLLLFSLLL
jgi:hypothetical protein